MGPAGRGADQLGVTVLPWVALVALAATLVVGRARRRPGARGLQVEELRRLHRAELAVATAPSTYAAAKELAGHALALLHAPVAVVLIEGAEDSVRVVRGDAEAASVYEPGSRMRLLDVDGQPVGSIAVGPRPDGVDYDERDEEVLDALAQRVSATLQRLALFEAVQLERGSLADVLDSSSDAIAAVGADLRVQAWNPAMARITGVPVEDALGAPCCQVFRPFGEDGSARHGQACPCRTGSPSEELLSITGPEGPRWLLTAFSARAGGGAVVVARDVTARKRLDDEKADFLATVSHELRTPLTPLRGFIQTLVNRGEEITGEERVQVYDVLFREEQRLERLVDQLLRATAGDHGVLDRSVAFDWVELVRQRAEAFERPADAPCVGVRVPSRRVGVRADPDALGLVLDELLSNAAKFTQPGVPVGVRVAVEGDRVTTVVEDGGPGVPLDDRERVFDRFTRLGDHMTRPQQGVGLGLYIARRTVEAMGGSIACEASPLGGAAFVIGLPVAGLPRKGKLSSPISWSSRC
jgi:signal transduction histidine kinase